MLLNLKNANLGLGNTVLLDNANFSLAAAERICLVGRNGVGKSTLLKVLAGHIQLDSGELMRRSTLHSAELPQDVPTDLPGTVYEVVAAGLGEAGQLLADYHHSLLHEPDNLNKLGRLQDALETCSGWEIETRVQTVLSRMNLEGDGLFANLSGGLKRRVLLARALVAEPDLLLLDEPTNHLDIDNIAWLENFLRDWNGSLLFITHDRAFLRSLATRIIELDRGHLTSWPGDYAAYLKHKAEALHAEALEQERFDKKLAQEEVWIRKGVQARRTRNEGRVRALKAMREQYRQRRTLSGSVNLVVQEAEHSGKLVAVAEGLHFQYQGKALVRDFSTSILRGDKVGIIGPNGAGKTTLINLMLGRLQPQQGQLRLGTNLQVAYFDQLRTTLDPDKPVFENIGDGREFVEINGARRHVMSYLQDFLFAPDRARSPVHALSGGERSRLLLAQLFTQPANLLVLDEPTNDLDVETLDLLEERLLEYQGTVILVSHDREFLDNVVTRTLAFEGDGQIGDYVGGYADWLRQRPAPPAATRPAASPAAAAKPAPTNSRSQLSTREHNELKALPDRIEKLEAQQAALGLELSEPDLYQRSPDKAQRMQRQLRDLEAELSQCYTRWEALETRKNSG